MKKKDGAKRTRTSPGPTGRRSSLRPAHAPDGEGPFRIISEITSDFAYTFAVAADGTLILEWISEAFARVTGYQPDEIWPRGNWMNLIHPDDLGTVLGRMGRVLAGETCDGPARLITKSGEVRWLHIYTLPEWDREQGRVVRVYGAVRDITDQKKAEEVLRYSEYQYRTTIDSLRDPVHVVDTDLRFILCNKALLKWIYDLGLNPDVVGRTVFEIFPFLPEKVRAEYRQVLESGEMLITEERTEVGGREFITETRKIPVIEEGRVVRVVTVMHDITERKHAEESLRESEERYRRLVETSPDAIILTDLQGNILVVNQQAVEAYGASSAEELVGKNAVDLIAPADRETAIANIRRTLEAGQVRGVEYQILRRDGTMHPVELNASLIRDAQGRPQAFIGVTRDISERKRADEVLWQTRMVVEHSPVILYRLRAEEGWPFEFVSDNVAQFGYAVAEIRAGRITLTQLVHPDDLPRVLSEMAEYAERGVDTFRREFRVVLRSGDIAWVEDRVVIVRGADGRVTHYQGILLDVTENRRLEEQFRQAQKMETVGRLAGGIAHDFNNFLTAIRGYAGLVYDTLRPEDPVRADMEQVLKATERAASLTSQLLAFSRRQIIEPRPVNLNDLVLETERMLHRIIGEDIELRLDLAPNLALVRVDAGQITQALVNLVLNARDAMPDGGVLTITTANVTAEQACLGEHTEVATAGPFVLLAVADSGVGMSEEVRAHLFEPFFTTKEVGHGTGLGLATVYGIVRQHQGHIAVQSAAGRGTTVRIYLPQIKGRVRPLPHRDVAERMPRGDETVLVVEDEPAVRALIVRILRGLGYTVLESANGNEAVKVARAHPARIHLLLTDVVMPQMDGKVLASLLRDVDEDLRVLYVSGYATDVLSRYGVLETGVAFLRKPFTGSALAMKVREVLDAEGSAMGKQQGE